MTYYESFRDFLLAYILLKNKDMVIYTLGNQSLDEDVLETKIVVYTKCGTIYHKSNIDNSEIIQDYKSLFEAGDFETNSPIFIDCKPDVTVKSSLTSPISIEELEIILRDDLLNKKLGVLDFNLL